MALPLTNYQRPRNIRGDMSHEYFGKYFLGPQAVLKDVRQQGIGMISEL